MINSVQRYEPKKPDYAQSGADLSSAKEYLKELFEPNEIIQVYGILRGKLNRKLKLGV